MIPVGGDILIVYICAIVVLICLSVLISWMEEKRDQ